METQNTVDSQDLPKRVMPPGMHLTVSETPKMLETHVQALSLCCALDNQRRRDGGLYRKSINWNAIYRDSVDGAMRVFFKHCMNIFTMRVPSQVSSLIPRSCAHMPRQRVPLKKRRTRGTGTRTNSRRIYDETESLSQRCLYTVAFYFDSGTP